MERCLPPPIDRDGSISGNALVRLDRKRIAILAACGFEQPELEVPRFPRPITTRW